MPIWLMMCSAVTAAVIAALFGLILIPFLRRIHFGQTILEEGPAWHKSKQGTPIMGGFLFIAGSIIATVIGYAVWRVMHGDDVTDPETGHRALRLLAVLLFSVCYSGACGFTDDYIKAVKKQNLGLNPRQKILFQIVFCGAFLAIMYALGDRETTIDLMFVKLNFGILYYPVIMLFMIYMINAVNLTDGIDGLCGSVTVVSMLALTVLCASFGQKELSLFSISLAGACIGFLVWNLHPAKCFMGDTGSMFLGGAFTGIGIACRMHLLLVLVGIVYVLDALSVVIQTLYFKYTRKKYGEGRRIFKMSPIHHHFELCKWSEYKIVTVFSLVGVLAAVIAVVSQL
ncbi:MAG: phospho-N-acetylmuramoyl-pentapeptide-transferase [Oscillospiraceae bacterium]|nr:phospho-N-acetylmuramoyl-pentapeptide-transferase [Oscillospiraceae bacterium]MCR4761819.1 phospho-N-acetylmuramoyl-pentapeptide-transferase [Oscillospiraceae bacterium]